MPAKNSIKQFIKNGYYHLYNRGVEKRIIFIDSQDYGVFTSYLKEYLLPKKIDELGKIIADTGSNIYQKDKARKLLRLNNFAESFMLIAYCFVPNHFHMLVKQEDADTIDRFMNSLCTRYSMYFNRKYKRVGPLFQGLYKAVLVETDEQLLHLSRYIHQNAQCLLMQGSALQTYPYSSYPQYLGLSYTDWVRPDVILSYFSARGAHSYQSFVEDAVNDVAAGLESLLLDDKA
jgi:putative transposase